MSARASAESCSANCCARARPMPEPAPVTTATPPLENNIRIPRDSDDFGLSVLPGHPSRPAHSYHSSTVLARIRETEEGTAAGVWPGPEKSSVRLDRDLVAPGAFSAVQRLIRLPHQFGEVRGLGALKPGNPEARRHRNNLAAEGEL